MSQYARTCSSTAWEENISAESLKSEQDRHNREKVNIASHILQQVAARKLNDHLKREGQVRLCMPVEEAISKAKEFGAAYSDEEVCYI